MASRLYHSVTSGEKTHWRGVGDHFRHFRACRRLLRLRGCVAISPSCTPNARLGPEWAGVRLIQRMLESNRFQCGNGHQPNSFGPLFRNPG